MLWKTEKNGIFRQIKFELKSYQLEILKILTVFFGIGRRLHSTKINNPYLAFKASLISRG